MKLISSLAAALLAIAPPLEAQTDIARVDLLPGWRDGPRHIAALKIELDPGWKTYWRSPGDAGIPPFFDWTGSTNLDGVRVLWPVPVVFEDNSLTSVGYKDSVVIPIEMTPRDPDAPITANLALNIGVCEEICVPHATVVTAQMPAGDAPRDGRIRAALVDRPLSAADAKVDKVACKITPTDTGVQLTAQISMPAQGADEYAIVELPGSVVWISQAQTRRQDTTLTAQVQIVPPEGQGIVVDRSALRFTILGGGTAVDIRGCT